jgi:hypothetical protein
MDTLAELIAKAADRSLQPDDFDAAARSNGVAPSELTDTFARAVVARFEAGSLPWTDADRAMNWLFFDYGIHSQREDLVTPLAARVFEAFDQGEYTHLGEPPNRQGESRTRALLAWAMTGDERLLAPFGPETTVPLVRATAASIAKRALAGLVPVVDAARELFLLRHLVGIEVDDPDFAAITRIHDGTAHLPLGDVRSLWALDALAEKDREIAASEEWAQRIGRTALMNIARRFGGAA